MGNHSGPSKDSDKYKNNSQTKLAAKGEFELNIKRFNKINVVGKGGFGKVCLYLFRFGSFKLKNKRNSMPSNKCPRLSNFSSIKSPI
jgi:hypothetical protein